MSTKEPRDALWRARVFPDAQSVFSAKPLQVSEIKDSCVVVVDASALLAPYEVGPNSLGHLRTIYQGLVTEKLLVIPAQVAREFANRRGDVLAAVAEKLHVKRINATKLQEDVEAHWPHLLRDIDPEYGALKESHQVVIVSLKNHVRALQALERRVRQWLWDDPVSAMYRELFADCVIENVDAEQVANDREWRYRHQVPPGYEDNAKPDGGIGDLLIWDTILRTGEERDCHVLFVTNEKKGDWWHSADGVCLWPRFELVSEYQRRCHGKTFQIADIATFTKLYGADAQTVDELDRASTTVRAIVTRRVLNRRAVGDAREGSQLGERVPAELTLAALVPFVERLESWIQSDDCRRISTYVLTDIQQALRDLQWVQANPQRDDIGIAIRSGCDRLLRVAPPELKHHARSIRWMVDEVERDGS